MSARLPRIAMALVRMWTLIYTAGLEKQARDRRREEIDSDLWNLAHDADRISDRSQSFCMLARLVLGIPDDLKWRIEMTRLQRVTFGSTIAAATVILAAMIWVNQSLRPPALPQPPPAPRPEILTLAIRKPPVPPPPPPLKQKGLRDPDWAGLLMHIRDLANHD